MRHLIGRWVCWVGAAAVLSAGGAVAGPACDALAQQPMNLRAFTTAAGDYSGLLAQPAAASRFLVCVKKWNPGLAEALMLYQRRLQRPSEVEAAFLHYVVNTQREPLFADESADVLRRLELSYRESLQLAAGSGPAGGQSTTLRDLRIFGRTANRSRYGRDDIVPTGLLEFSESSTGYSHLNAVWMAELSALAYWDPVLMEKQLHRWGYKLVAVIADDGTDTNGFLATKDDHMVLAFRGTSSLRDFISDAKIKRVRAPWAKGLLHRGFAGALDGVWSQITRNLGTPEQQKKQLSVTGHSLGAALAQLAALRLAKLHYAVQAVYTYGTPRVGDGDFVADYDRLLGDRTFPHINRRDVVTRVPLPSFGYRTAASKQIRQFTGAGHTLKRLDASPDGSTEASVWGDVIASIRRTTDFLPAALRPPSLRSALAVDPPSMFYSNEDFREGRLDEHGSFQYLFKLACVALEKDLWPVEFTRANGRPR